MKKIKEISIRDYKLLSSKMIDRHYYFEITISYEDYSDTSINKRYSEIEELYKILILKYPGCRIPKFPIKTFLMNIHITDEAKKDIITKMEKFLNHIINHKILREKNVVKEFFSDHKINKNHTLKTDMMQISEDNVNDSEFNINEDLNKNENNNNDYIDKEEIDEITKEFEVLEFKNSKDYEAWYENNSLNDLLNMFLEEENKEKKGIIDKTKGIISSTYNYLTSNYSQDNLNLNNNISENSLTESAYQEETIKSIEKMSDELGEDNNVNEYGKEILKINEGLSYLIKNFENIKSINQTKLQSLKNIKKICGEDVKYNHNKNKDKKDQDNMTHDKDKKIDKKEKWDRKIYANEINNKLDNYITLNSEFCEKELKDVIDKINEIKRVVEEMKEIFERKKHHINFLIKLNSKLTEIEKKKVLDPENKALEKDYNFIKKNFDIEKEFIKKLNKDLNEEINFFKENIENNVYKYINDLYLNNFKKQNEIFNKLNEEISLDSGSENSSKDESFEKISSSSDKNIDIKLNKDEIINEKKERKDSIKSNDDF